MTGSAVAVPLAMAKPGWRVHGRAQIDDRPAAPCTLTIGSDGTWSAEVATFTLAGACDLMLISAEGGQFCGPATVARSQAHSDPFAAYTELVGAGPLLVVAPSQREQLQIEDAEMVDGEVVE